MLLLCAERDRLWADYDAALYGYMDLVKRMLLRPWVSTDTQAKAARDEVFRLRREAERHCERHGCAPEMP